MRYTKKRSYEWSPHIAYSVGLMASDGCLSGDGRHIDLTSVDIDQLENFRVALGRDIPISRKSSGAGRFAYRCQFSDVAYYDFLLEAGLTPNKSKTIPELAIDPAYFSDFFRGVFDGDGTTYGFMDTRWRSSYTFYIAIASASLPFIQYLQFMNTKLFGISHGSYRFSSGVFILSYAKADSYKLYE